MGTTTKAKFGVLESYDVEPFFEDANQLETIYIYNDAGKELELSDSNGKWGRQHMKYVAEKCEKLKGKPIIVSTYEKNNVGQHWTPARWFYDIELDNDS